MGGDLLVMADAIYKFWSEADFWQDVFDDQPVFSAGLQWSPSGSPWIFRAGGGWAEDPNRSVPNGQVGNITQVVTGPGANPLIIPTDPNFVVPYLQATQTEVVYEWRIGLGLGYKGFLAPFLDLDVGFGWEFARDRDFGTSAIIPGAAHSNAETYSWHAGFGLTWRFMP